MRAWLLILGMIATPAVAADQFDLLCRGKNIDVRYRVDLTKGEYCDEDCSLVRKIASVNSGAIILQDRRPSFRGDSLAFEQVNRKTGAWIKATSNPAVDIMPSTIQGTCEPAEYSGIGTNRKF